MNSNVPCSGTASVCVISDTVSYHREPPPPYTENDNPITRQPVVQQTIIFQPHLKESPTLYMCPECRERVLTKVQLVNTKKTHMISGFIFGFTCWCCLCCLAVVPYLIPVCKKTQHFCPQCQTFLGPN